MTSPDRPLSPHLQIYRWQITSVLSILHRLTGLWLGVGLLALSVAIWLVAPAPAAYRSYAHFLTSPLGLILLVSWSFCFFYHLLNGIRHLFWDLGHGFAIVHFYRSGWLVVVGSLLLVLVVWGFVLY